MENISRKIIEASHFNTKVRQLEGMGSRKIRLAIKESGRMINAMLDKKNPAPNPKGDLDRIALQESTQLLEQAMIRLKSVKESKAKRK